MDGSVPYVRRGHLSLIENYAITHARTRLLFHLLPTQMASSDDEIDRLPGRLDLFQEI